MFRRTLTRALPAAVAMIALAASAASASGARPAAPPRTAHVVRVPADAPTVQAAVDAAKPGDTVAIGAGTYTGEVVVTKDLTLRGAGIDATIIKAPATLTPYAVHLPTGRSLTAIVRVAGNVHVDISNLTVRGPIPCGIEVSGVHALQGATLDLTDARVTGLQADPATCSSDQAAGRAVVFGTPVHIDVDGVQGTTAFGRVSHVRVDHYQHAGISVAGPVEGAPSRVSIDHDSVEGGWSIPTSQVGVWVEDGGVVRVEQSRITDNRCGGDGCGGDPMSEIQGIGVFLLAVPAGSVVDGNVITGNDVGVNPLASPDCCRISHNVIAGQRWFGVVIQDGNGTTDGNWISDVPTGIAVVADSDDTTGVLRHDRITRTSDAPVRELNCCGVTAHAVVIH